MYTIPVLVITLTAILPSCFSLKERRGRAMNMSIKWIQEKCPTGRTVFISDAYCCDKEKNTNCPCKPTVSAIAKAQQPKTSSPPAGGECSNQFSLRTLRELYSAVDNGDPKNLERFQNPCEKQGEHLILFDCFNVRDDVFNPCGKKKESPKKYTAIGVFFDSEISWARDHNPCHTKCTFVPDSAEPLIWWNQFLLKNEDSKKESFLSYKVLETEGSKGKNWTRLASTYFKRTVLGYHVKELKMKFSLKDPTEVSRLWIYFNGTKFTVTCSEKHVTKPATMTTPSSPGQPAIRFPPIGFIISTVVVWIAVIILIIVIVTRKNSRKDNPGNEDNARLVSVAREPSPQGVDGPNTQQDDTGVRMDLQRRSNVPRSVHYSETSLLLHGQVTGRGHDDRDYDHFLRLREREGGDDDYHHLAPEETPSGYSSVLRELRRQVVVDNPYDHFNK